MSEILIDSGLLERWVDKLDGSDSAGYGWEDLLSAEMRAILAQPVVDEQAERKDAARWRLYRQGFFDPEALDASVDSALSSQGGE